MSDFATYAATLPPLQPERACRGCGAPAVIGTPDGWRCPACPPEWGSRLKWGRRAEGTWCAPRRCYCGLCPGYTPDPPLTAGVRSVSDLARERRQQGTATGYLSAGAAREAAAHRLEVERLRGGTQRANGFAVFAAWALGPRPDPAGLTSADLALALRTKPSTAEAVIAYLQGGGYVEPVPHGARGGLTAWALADRARTYGQEVWRSSAAFPGDLDGRRQSR